MEGEYLGTTAKAIVTKPAERRAEPGVWSDGELRRQLLVETRIAYEALPQTIHLSDALQQEIGQVVAHTAQDGREWALSLYKIQQRGERDPRLIVLGPQAGSAELADVPRIRPYEVTQFMAKHNLAQKPQIVGTIHTHPSQNPLWTADLFSPLINPDKKAEMVAIKAGTFLALKTASTPLVGDDEEQGAQEIEALRKKLVALGTNQPPEASKATNEWSATLYATENACQDYKIGLYFGKPGEPLRRLA